MRRTAGTIAVVAYVATIILANWVVKRYGIVPVGFGFMAPAAVYLVGVAFTLRDLVQEWLGRTVVVAAIFVGAGVSALISPQFAMASGVAFLISEFADFAVYTPLRDRHWLGAVALSNVVGLTLDSILFLWLAFHSLHFLPGQMVGKAWMTLLAIAALSVYRRGRMAQA